MKLLEEFHHALSDGLGKDDAKKFTVTLWSSKPAVAIAYSLEKKQLYMLILEHSGFSPLTGDQYLDTAKQINKKLGTFVVPAQRIGPFKTLWGGKTRGPVHVYRFKIFNTP